MIATTSEEMTVPRANGADADPSAGFWTDVWRRFKRNRIALAGFYVVCFFGFMAVF